jgi:hypothetical protein
MPFRTHASTATDTSTRATQQAMRRSLAMRACCCKQCEGPCPLNRIGARSGCSTCEAKQNRKPKGLPLIVATGVETNLVHEGACLHRDLVPWQELGIPKPPKLLHYQSVASSSILSRVPPSRNPQIKQTSRTQRASKPTHTTPSGETIRQAEFGGIMP